MLTRLTNLKTAPTVAAGLIAGFGVAEVTGVRAIGGVVLAAAGIAAGTTSLKRDGGPTTTALSAVYLGGFVGSHFLAHEIGAWPSVFTVSAISAAAAYALSDRKTARSTSISDGSNAISDGSTAEGASSTSEGASSAG